ncbi:MAG: sugar phosphate isomerase [Clostridia bacterium]|nr:sugar phosphate isomerase [Clostridia bacterium]
MLTKPIALQLYTVRDYMEKDFFGVLEKVAKMGYKGVEFAGFYGQSAEVIRKTLDNLGLCAISSHLAFNNMLNNLDNEIAYHKIIGCKFVAVPYADDERRPGGLKFEETLKLYAQIGKKFKENDLELLYHNHDFEFINYKNMFGLDYMYQNVPSEYLNPEIDTCWVNVAGQNPAAYIEKYKGRCKVLHLKDFVMGKAANNGDLYALIDEKGNDLKKVESKKEDGFDFRPVGYGQQNVPSIIAAAEKSGVEWYVVEQDRSTLCSSLEAAKLSIDYLNKL